MATRLIGQDTTVTIVKNNQPITAIDTVKSCEITVQLEILKEGFLGQTTDLRDEVFRGIAGKMDLQLASIDALSLIDSIMQRAKNRQSGTRVTIKTTFQFPNGQRAIFVIPDVKFGEVPINNAGRTDYVAMSLSFEADDMQFISRG